MAHARQLVGGEASGSLESRPAESQRTTPAEPANASIADLARAIAARREQLRQAIGEAAYYRAERRGFAAGHELEDWLAAQDEILHG